MRDDYTLGLEHGQGKHRFWVNGCLVCEAEGRTPALAIDTETLPGLMARMDVTRQVIVSMESRDWITSELLAQLRRDGATEEQISRARIDQHDDVASNMVSIVASVPALQRMKAERRPVFIP